MRLRRRDRSRGDRSCRGAAQWHPGLVTGSEDVGLLATAAGAPCVFWLLGGADPAEFAAATSFAEVAARVGELPSNHSPLYAPVIEPTLTIGVSALVAAAREWLPPATSS